MNNADFELISLGYCSNDHLCRVPAIPVDHKVEIIEHQIQGGGPAATAAVCAARLGVRTLMLTAVGDDADGRRMIADLRSEQINVDSIAVRKNCGSPFAQCWIDPQGRRSVAWTHNGLKLLTADELPYELIARAKVLHLDGHHPEAALAAAKYAADHHCMVSFDAGTIKNGVEKFVELADILICSEYFARTFSGRTELHAALSHLAATYHPTVLGVTCGAGGSFFFIDGQLKHFPAFQVPVVDTTGAGDAFHGAFAVQFLQGADIGACVRFASAVSALKCGKLGARAGLPTLDEVKNFLKSH